MKGSKLQFHVYFDMNDEQQAEAYNRIVAEVPPRKRSAYFVQAVLNYQNQVAMAKEMAKVLQDNLLIPAQATSDGQAKQPTQAEPQQPKKKRGRPKKVAVVTEPKPAPAVPENMTRISPTAQPTIPQSATEKPSNMQGTSEVDRDMLEALTGFGL